MIAFFVITAAIVLDWVIGEPKKFHPLVLFGSIADRIEQISGGVVFQKFSLVIRGFICWFCLVVPPTLGLWILLQWVPFFWQLVLECLILYFTIGWRSMQQHAIKVYEPLLASDIESARDSVKKIVSRETEQLNERGVAKGAVEAVLENGSDCLISPIFWYLLLGAPGALMFRFANTLDAMWGNKSDRYIYFGFAAAKIDDYMNWIPARLTAGGYAVCGRFLSAFACMKNQNAESEGPNAGLVMAAGGGALEIRLGGPVVYDGKLDVRPTLGSGREVEALDIIRSIRLVWRTITFWMLIIAIISIFVTLKTRFVEI